MRQIQLMRWCSILALSALAGVGCGDDDDDDGDGDGDGQPEEDAGLDAGGFDAGADAGGADGGALSCGGEDATVECSSATIANTVTLPACCAEESNACGLDVSALEQFTQGLFAGCIERNQPSVPAGKEVSAVCTGIWEILDDTPLGDAGATEPDAGVTDAGSSDGGAEEVNGYTLTVAGQSVSFPGCCRLTDEGTGECGFVANEVLGTELGFGCLPLDNFRNLFPSDTAFEQVRATAVCDPATGEALLTDGGVGDDAGTGDAGATDAGVDGG